MQVQQAKTIYLKDYKPSSFFIESVELDVDIFQDKTIVKNKMRVVKSNSCKNKPTHLELNGEQVVLKKIQINGQELKNEDYQLSQDKLVILNVKEDDFILEIDYYDGTYQNSRVYLHMIDNRKIYVDATELLDFFKLASK